MSFVITGSQPIVRRLLALTGLAAYLGLAPAPRGQD